ncbi:MAG: bifunctional UDP-N-acetylmuramoyl-tripeptide:D-alanyl-D-alanine ligase/alanine racemase [Ferruginibacter sp.]
MQYTSNDIARITGGRLSGIADSVSLHAVSFDSRKIHWPHETLFAALPGEQRHGYQYIPEAYEKGVRHFLIQETANTIEQTYPDSLFIRVPDVLKALQAVATHHRKQTHLPFIGITGSNGKTVIKEWLHQLMSETYRVARSPKSYNSQIGVPVSLLQVDSSNDYAIIEAGISKPGEMKRLEAMICPDIGILSFMGEAHAEHFTSPEEKIREKLILFHHAKKLIYCSDSEWVCKAITAFATEHTKTVLFDWGSSSSAMLQVLEETQLNDGLQITCLYQSKLFNIHIPFNDAASRFNVLTCVATLLALGLNIDVYLKALTSLVPVEMRLQQKQGIHDCILINDSYSADFDALKIALDFLEQQSGSYKRTLILSDLPETGTNEPANYERLAKLLDTRSLYRLIGIGPSFLKYQHLFSSESLTHFYETTEAFIKTIDLSIFQREAILLKGARRFQFERISTLLEEKLHETVLEISMNALRNNVKAYRRLLKPGVRCMAMVKAFSYGSGSHEVAGLLQDEGVEYLAVAYTDEGIALRKSGIQLPIMVMNPSSTEFESLVRYKLEPELFSFRILTEFTSYLHLRGIRQYPVHLKLDTGMHRLGFLSTELKTLCTILSENQAVRIESVFTHLAASEDPSEDNYTEKQAAVFKTCCNSLQTILGYSFLKHVCNSAAIVRHAHLHFDMVRLGIGLYGADNNLPLDYVATLKTTITQIKKLRAGETVGYGRKGKLERDSAIATVRVGYADGYPRALSNGIGYMLVNGQKAPVIGNICMDMTMLDVTGLDVQEGEMVIVFGESPTVSEIANLAGTIPYEILTGISQRVKRVYYQE